jgi:hypothetical protein
MEHYLMTNATIVTLNSVLASVSGYTTSANTTAKKGAALTDDMLALGILPSIFYAPKKDDPPVSFTLTDGTGTNHADLYEKLKSAVIAAMPAKDRGLIQLPKKAVPAHLKEARLAAQRAIGARMADMRKALERRLKPAKDAAAKDAAAGETGEPSKNSCKVKIAERLIAAMKIAQKDESPDYQINKLVRAITDAMTALGMDMPEEK